MSKLGRALRESFLPLLLLLAAIVITTLVLDRRAERLTRHFKVIRLAPSMGGARDGKLSPESVATTGNSQFSRLFTRGLDRQRRGELQAARNDYEEALRLKPNHFESTFNLGLLEMESGDYQAAVVRMRAAANLAGGAAKARAIFALGLALARAGERRAAIRAYERAVEYQPNFLPPRYNLAKLYIDDGSTEAVKKAEKLLADILALQESYAPALFLRGRLASRRGQIEEALEYYHKAALHDATFWKARKNAGLMALRLGRLARAERIFTRLAADFPARSDGEFNLGVVAYRRRQFEKALRHYRKALQISGGKHKQAGMTTGLTLRALGRYPEALDVFDAILAADPADAAAQVNRGLVLIQMGRLDEARKAFQKAIDARPDYAVAYYNLGKLEAGLKRFDSAEAAYRKTLAIDPKHLKAAVNLGILLSKRGDLEGAVAAYRAATSIAPQYAPSYYNLGLALRKMDRLQEAMGAYRRAIELDEEHVGARINLGVIHALLSQVELAVKMFNEVLDLAPSNVKARYNLALQYLKMGRADRAEQELRRVLQIDPEHLLAMKSLKNLLHSKEVSDDN